MHRYKQITYILGNVIEIIKCHPFGCRKGIERGPKKTKDEIRKANLVQAARKLARKINANFKPGDMHVILTYKREERPSPEEAKKLLRKFLKKMRKEYKNHGFELKYIHATEYKNKAIHHHLIVNNVNDGKKTTKDYIRKLWAGKGSPKYVDLYDNGEYQALADYLIKETEKTFRDGEGERQRYGCSRNLVNPKPHVEIKKVKGGWKQNPEPKKGYYIQKDSLYNGFDKFGYPYQRYLMIRLEGDDLHKKGKTWKA